MFALVDPIRPGPATRGAGRLRTELVDGLSAAVEVESAEPLRILVPQPRGRAIIAYTSNYGGGLVAGDQLDISLSIGAATQCFLGSQSSTKIYRNPEGIPSGQSMRASIAENAILAVVPDPVQMFAESVYQQEQSFDLALSSGLILFDAISCGRPSRGERWAFTSYQSKNTFRLDGKVVQIDAMTLDHQNGSLTLSPALGRYGCIATLALVGRAVQEPAEKIRELLGGRPVPRRSGLVFSASPTPHGIFIRMAGEHSESVLQFAHGLLDLVTDTFHAATWRRRF